MKNSAYALRAGGVTVNHELQAVRYALELHDQGRNLTEIAAGLNIAGYRTRRGAYWTTGPVGSVLSRANEYRALLAK